jgi:hypothetical protein
MRAGFSFSYPPISLLLGQPLSIKKSYAGAIQIVSLDFVVVALLQTLKPNSRRTDQFNENKKKILNPSPCLVFSFS